MEYKVYGTIGKDYKIVDVVDTCRDNAKYKAKDLYKGFEPVECVSAEWEQLFNKYHFLWHRLNEAGAFKPYDDSDILPTVNGWEVNLNCLSSFGFVLLNNDDWIIDICYLNEEEFEHIVWYFEICAKTLNL